MEQQVPRLRIDKWLWAARFFKTRSLAKQAIEGGKVQLGRNRVKVSKEICVGDHLLIRQGWDEVEIVVQALSDKRRGAPEAALLYLETEASVSRREKQALARKAAGGMINRPENRPSKKQRRQIHRFRQEQDYE